MNPFSAGFAIRRRGRQLGDPQFRGSRIRGGSGVASGALTE